MTKNVSLADDAYEALNLIKGPEESFSDLARRLARLAAQESLFDPTRKPIGNPQHAKAWIDDVYAARAKETRKRVRLP